jgi:hypothetical protein
MLKRFACALAFALAASAAVSGEWSTWPGSNSTYVAVGIEQDGAGLILICDTNRMLVSIGFEEPHARWQKGAPVEMVTIPDGTMPLPPSHGIVIGPTRMIVENDAAWRTMGQARKSVAVTVGDYSRVFPVANLREAVEPVLRACGDHW